METKKKKRGFLVPLVILLVLLGGCALIFGSGGDDQEEATTETTTAATEATTAALVEATTETVIDTEAARQRVAEIKAQAQEDAKDATGIELNNAASHINRFLSTCLSDRKEMEDMLGYAYLLYFHYPKGDPARDLGYDAVKTIRPVYEEGADPQSDEVQGYIRAASADIDRLIEKSNANNNTTTEAQQNDVTVGEQNALDKAKSYLDYSAFSKEGLRKQLEFEGFQASECEYAVENCGADWNEQAVKKANDYLNYSSFSKSALIDQLKYEGFTDEQAQYGADQAYQ